MKTRQNAVTEEQRRLSLDKVSNTNLLSPNNEAEVFFIPSHHATTERSISVLLFCSVEILLLFNLVIPQCFTSIYQAFDGQSEFLRLFNFLI